MFNFFLLKKQIYPACGQSARMLQTAENPPTLTLSLAIKKTKRIPQFPLYCLVSGEILR